MAQRIRWPLSRWSKSFCDLRRCRPIALANAALLLAWLALAGGAVAGTLFGVYLYVSSRWLDIGHVDAFSAMRRDSHRHFLRIRIRGDEITVYPIGLDRTPRRREWRAESHAIAR